MPYPHVLRETILKIIGLLELAAKLCLIFPETTSPLQHWKRPSPQSAISLLPGEFDFASMQNSKLCKTASLIGLWTTCENTINPYLDTPLCTALTKPTSKLLQISLLSIYPLPGKKDSPSALSLYEARTWPPTHAILSTTPKPTQMHAMTVWPKVRSANNMEQYCAPLPENQAKTSLPFVSCSLVIT